MHEWRDETTGRRVRQLTDLPDGAWLAYFRFPKQLPGGLVLANAKHDAGEYIALDPERGQVSFLPVTGSYLKLRERDGRAWLVLPHRKLAAADLPFGKTEIVAELPDDLPGDPADVTCDGRTLLVQDITQDSNQYPVPFYRDVEAFWRWIRRPRSSRLWAYDIATGQRTLLVETDGVAVSHVDVSPTDPALVRFCHDSFGPLFQRIWTVRTDGRDLHPIRPQVEQDMVMHEFWWPDGQSIAYKYQQRNDATAHDLPWAEYAPVPTRFCLAGLDGAECYRSEPINNWHSHIFVSPDGTRLCGEGTDGDSFAYAARFSRASPKVDFTWLATIHTPYKPIGGQSVHTTFSANNRWLLFNDTVTGKLQVCAVDLE